MDSAQSPARSNVSLRETLEEQRATARDQLSAAWQLHVARIEQQLSTGWKDHLEQVIEERFGEITGSLEEAFARELEARFADLRRELRRELGARLHQLLRRLRLSESDADLYQSLLDGSEAFSRRAALFLVNNQTLRCAGSRDFAADSSGQLSDVEMALASAPALLCAVQAKDTVVAQPSAAELSPELAGFLGEAPGRKVGLFPVVCRDETVAVLCADSAQDEAEITGLELMTMLAGLTLEAHSAAAPPPAPVAEPTGPEQVIRVVVSEPNWPQLSSEDREIHLRAQRFARVQVAEMRLYQAQAVRTGRAQEDLYATLGREIDAARDAFRLDFVAPCASMADYLHLEMVRSLANDDASLLGPAYPGPLV